MELKVFLYRYDGSSIASELRLDHVRMADNQAVVELPLGEDDEFEILFQTGGLPVDEFLLNQARSLMCCIGSLDNEVQKNCAEECRRTGLHPRYFESELVAIELSPNSARLCYFGAGVNTDWDEVAEFEDGTWHYVGTASGVSDLP